MKQDCKIACGKAPCQGGGSFLCWQFQLHPVVSPPSSTSPPTSLSSSLTLLPENPWRLVLIARDLPSPHHALDQLDHLCVALGKQAQC